MPLIFNENSVGLNENSVGFNLQNVISCSLLITGNTVGASMMILPQTAEKIGMHNCIGIMGGKRTKTLVN